MNQKEYKALKMFAEKKFLGCIEKIENLEAVSNSAAEIAARLSALPIDKKLGDLAGLERASWKYADHLRSCETNLNIARSMIVNYRNTGEAPSIKDVDTIMKDLDKALRRVGRLNSKKVDPDRVKDAKKLLASYRDYLKQVDMVARKNQGLLKGLRAVLAHELSNLREDE